MVNIGTTDFYINVPSLPRGEFESYSSLLFDDWENYVHDVLELQDYSLSLNVEEGSIKAKAKIAATTLGILYIGIGQYGSFISGLGTIESQVISASEYLGQRAGKPFSSRNIRPNIRRRGESLSRLKGIFEKIKRGQISVEEAMIESEILFGPEMKNVPGLIDDLENAFAQAPLMPQQIHLPLVSADGEELMPDEEKNTKKNKPTKPKEPIPAPDHYRIEVWRESKKSKRNLRVVDL
ncbi:hypothetical protein [Pelagibaculum spongiae]|uniref:Uncharacterized protein n=1 Tax=Pelagibaculum spongiae TaxID=2080658 RepID=A0A2V1GYA9_9GAMM|nr:hypothetical protein [Pelagibaculum spongiae]PVZ69625.1 hypothetical protein DC094_09985 [Pelagibaculum spongiae]